MSKEQTNSKTKSLAIKYYLDNDVSQKSRLKMLSNQYKNHHILTI